MAETTAIYMIRPTPAKKSALARIVADLEQQRGSVPGFIGTNLAVYTDDFLDWAVVITFDSRDSLSRWLSSNSHTRFLDALEQQGLAKDPEMTELEPGGRPPLGCAVITHRVKRYQTEPFLDYQANHLLQAASQFDGYIGATLLPSVTDREVWTVLLKFRTEEELTTWMRSEERAKALPGLRDLLEGDFSTATGHSPFGAIIRMVGGAPVSSPTWKIVMLVVLVLFPTVTVLLSFWNELMMDLHVEPGVASVGSQLIATSLVTWFWMPWVSRLFNWWIDPIEGASAGRSLLGGAAMIVLYALEIGFFALVPVLTPWG